MTSTRTCPACEGENTAVARHCQHCGQLLAAAPPAASVVPSPGPNTLGNASLVIGIVAATAMFGLLLCTLTSINWGILEASGTPLLICAATAAFMSFIGVVLGVVGLFGKGQRRGPAVVGLVLSVVAICILLGALGRAGG